MDISKLHNVSDLRNVAKKRLPQAIFDYMDGGADDELTLRENTEGFNDYNLIPEILVDVSKIDTSCRLLGVDMALPFYLSPSGGSGLFHKEKDVGVAKAAEKAGIIFGLSTFSTTSIEEIAGVSKGPKMFQVYILKDRELSREFITRAKAAEYDAICLTVDSSISGNRERDLRSGLSFPPRLKPSTLLDFAFHPSWALGFLTGTKFEMSNIAHKMDALGNGMNTFELAHHLMDVSVTWKDAEWLRQEWGGAFAIKGIQSVEDAKRAVEIGASAIIVSTHGGRQLDTGSAPVHRIQPIREAVGDGIEIVLDSGIRRGTHILKALALGADAVSFARPYLYGLAAGGETGVSHAINMLRTELERGMGLLGVTSIDQIKGKHIVRAGR